MKKYLAAIIAAAMLLLARPLFAQVEQQDEVEPRARALTPLEPQAATLTAPTTMAAQIQISWTDNSNNELNFNIYRCTGTQAVPTCVPTVKVASTPPDVSSYTDTFLNDPGNTPLCYSIDASNDAGFSSRPPTACTRTAAIIVVKVAPTAPTGIRTVIVAVSASTP